MLAMGESPPSLDELQSQLTMGKVLEDKHLAPVNKEELQFDM